MMKRKKSQGKIVDAFKIGLKTRNNIIIRMRECKIPDHYIAKVFGLHNTHIYHICGGGSKFTLDQDRVASIINDLRNTNLNYRQISAKHGVCTSTVHDHANRHNLRRVQLTTEQLKQKYKTELEAFKKEFKKKFGREFAKGDVRHMDSKLAKRCYDYKLFYWQDAEIPTPKLKTAKPHFNILKGESHVSNTY